MGRTRDAKSDLNRSLKYLIEKKISIIDNFKWLISLEVRFIFEIDQFFECLKQIILTKFIYCNFTMTKMTYIAW